jgi:hypothetical protein
MPGRAQHRNQEQEIRADTAAGRIAAAIAARVPSWLADPIPSDCVWEIQNPDTGLWALAVQVDPITRGVRIDGLGAPHIAEWSLTITEPGPLAVERLLGVLAALGVIPEATQ